MAKKEKWITKDSDHNAEVEKFSTDPLKFGIEILEWFYMEDEAEEWEDLYKKDNSKRIKDCIKEITDGRIEYDRCEGGFYNTYDGAYMKKH